MAVSLPSSALRRPNALSEDGQFACLTDWKAAGRIRQRVPALQSMASALERLSSAARAGLQLQARCVSNSDRTR
jgi:hypothetical protein